MYFSVASRSAVKFSVAPRGGVNEVALVGDFNAWQPTPMNRRPDGAFELVLPLKTGSYQYKFVLDDRCVKDPDNTAWTIGTDGTLHSVARIL